MVMAEAILFDAEIRRFPPFRQLPEGKEYEAMGIGQLLTKFADLRKKNLSDRQGLDLSPADYAREAGLGRGQS